MKMKRLSAIRHGCLVRVTDSDVPEFGSVALVLKAGSGKDEPYVVKVLRDGHTVSLTQRQFEVLSQGR